jgi:hypothetical protein
MKSIKFIFSSLLFVVISTIGTAFESYKGKGVNQKLYTMDSYVWVNSNLFLIGTIPATDINTSSNWNVGTNPTGGFTYLSQIDVTYTVTSPSMLQVLDVVKTEYDRLYSYGSGVLLSVFTDGYCWSTIISGTPVLITIHLQW